MALLKVLQAALCSDAARLFLAVLIIAGILGLLFTDRSVPEYLVVIAGTIVGFYFGGLTAK